MGTGASIPAGETEALEAGYTQEQIDDYKKKTLQETSPAPAAATAAATNTDTATAAATNTATDATASDDLNEWAHAFNKDGELQMIRTEETQTLFNSRAVDGKWSLEPFADLVRFGNPELTDEEVDALFVAVDTDGDGKISYREFEEYFFDMDAAVKSTAHKKKGLAEADVYVRFRPFSKDGGHSEKAAGGNRNIQLKNFDAKGVTMKEAKGNVRYKFMRQVVTPEVSQQDMYRVVAAQFDEAVTMQQHNCMLLAYGQTGTGKTHTMLGPRESLESDTEHPEWGTNYILTASAIEFYLSSAFDLLDDKHSQVIIDKQTGEPVSATQIEINKVSQLATFMEKVNSNRTMAKTGMNSVSSRSHAALILTLHQFGRSDLPNPEYANTYCKTSFTLMDLAGAERVSKTGAKFVGGYQIFMELAEAKKKGKPAPIGAQGALINFELTEMNTAVNKATMRWKQGLKYQVPKGMTTDFIRFVSSCMEGRTRLGMIICCSQSPSNGGETWFSLKMGKGMARLRAPLSKSPIKKISWFVNKAKKVLAANKKKLARTPKGHMYYDLRVAELAAAESYLAVIKKIQTVHTKAAAGPKEGAAAVATE